MAITKYLKINSLDYTIPEDFVDETMRDNFRKIVDYYNIPQRSLVGAPPPSDRGLTISAYLHLIEVLKDQTLLDKEKLAADKSKHWFFNTFSVPDDYNDAELRNLPDSELGMQQATEITIIDTNE